MTHYQDTGPILGTRTVFNGVTAEEIFSAETVPLPELAVGEILVKVIKC
jgi:hypothetical protein